MLTSSNPSSKSLPIILLLISVLFLSVLSGILAAFGNVILLIALLVLYSLFFILAAPVSWIVWIIFWSAFLITGASAYFMRFSQLQWLNLLMAAALLLPIVFHVLRGKLNTPAAQIPAHLYWIVLFLILLIFSTIIDRPQLAEMVNASRHYLFMWPLMLVFMFGMVRQEMLVQLWKALMIVAILQFPMALYQYFFVAKSRAGLAPWDAVVGTFPGNADGGGHSAAMACMLLIAMLTAIALWRAHKIHGAWTSLVVVAGLGTLVLAEVKAMVLMLPVVIGMYYFRELMRRPVESIVVIVTATLMVNMLFLGYEVIHYGDKSSFTLNQNQRVSTFERITHALNPETESGDGSRLGRATHVVMWWNTNVESGDLQHSLFGYGMGATQSSNIGVGELVRRLPYSNLDVSTTTILLWETGILGHLTFFLILLSGAWVSGRTARNEDIPDLHRILLKVGTVGLLLLIITLPYKNFHFRSIPIQFIMMLMLGQAAYWSRFLSSSLGQKKLHKASS